MAKYSLRSAGLVGGCLLVVSALFGCSAGSAEPAPAEESVSQDPLLFGLLCGGPTHDDCSTDKFCTNDLLHGCKDTSAIGVCLPRPDHCPATNDPVCGCDGTSYGNLCKAAAAGAQLAHRGQCATPPASDTSGPKCPGAGTCVASSSAPWWVPIPRSQPGTCTCDNQQTCPTGQRFNDSPLVCACEAAVDPCMGVACKHGEMCIDQGGMPACVADSCTGVACKNGQVCVVLADQSAACVPNSCSGVACKNGESCMVASDGSAACWPNACMGIACKNGQSCVVLPDGTAGCQ